MELFGLLDTAMASLTNGQLPSGDVARMIISKLLGYAILVGACIVKLPQVFNVVRSQSAEGLNALSFELETVGFLVGLSYGYIWGLPFSTYGETVFLFAQNVVLLFLIYKYSKKPVSRAVLLGSLLSVGMACIVAGHVSQQLIQLAYDGNTGLFIASRLPQIYQNWTNKSTGQLSAITQGLQFAGAMARIFTSLQENTGAAMLRGFLLGTFFNGVLLLQILIYGSKPKPKNE